MINENKINFPSQKDKDSDETMVDEFKNFIDENNFTADQMKEAMHSFYGISDASEKDPAVEKIVKEMNKMVEKNFSLNKFAELFKAKKEYENAVPNYLKYVDELNITSKEKRVLQSIVGKKRKGEVEIIVDGITIARFGIEDSSIPEEILAIKLETAIRKNIKRIPESKKYGFTFSEN